MKCVLCEEGTTTEVQETFMFSPRGYVRDQALMVGVLCDTCGVFHSSEETFQKTLDYCQNLKKKMAVLKKGRTSSMG